MIALRGTETSSNLHEGLYSMPQVKSYENIERVGNAQSQWSINHFDLDGHAAHTGLVARRRDELLDACKHTDRTPLVSSRHCGDHAEHLVENDTIEVFGVQFYSFVASAAAFFRMGGNFVRLIQATVLQVQLDMVDPVLVDDSAEAGAAQAHAQVMNAEVEDYAIRNYKTFIDERGDDVWSDDEALDGPHGSSEPGGDDVDSEEGERAEAAEKRRKKVRKRTWLYAQAWKEFFALWTTCIWVAPGFCLAPNVVDVIPQNLPAYKARCAQKLVALLFRCMPVKPSKGKWTKFGRAIDFFLLSMGVQCAMMRSWVRAFSKLSVRAIQASTFADPDLEQDFHWHQLRGKREAFIRGSMNEDMLQRITICCIVLEPLKYITKWFMRRSSPVRRIKNQRAGKAAPIFDLANPLMSPIMRVLQSFISSWRVRLRGCVCYGGGPTDPSRHGAQASLDFFSSSAERLVWRSRG